VAVRKVNHQRGSILKAQPMTILIISSAFVSLQSIPRLVVDVVLLVRAA